ncbi:MAG: hypothetical protein ACTS3F_00570 [Phycisphaerales bacterium]
MSPPDAPAPHDPRTPIPVPEREPPPPSDPSPRIGVCLVCGFDQEGLDRQPRCPECGFPHDEAAKEVRRRIDRIARGTRILRPATKLFVLGILVLLMLYTASEAGGAVGSFTSPLLTIWAVTMSAGAIPLLIIMMVGIFDLSARMADGPDRLDTVSIITRGCALIPIPVLAYSLVSDLDLTPLVLLIIGMATSIGTVSGLSRLRRRLAALLGIGRRLRPDAYEWALRLLSIALLPWCIALITVSHSFLLVQQALVVCILSAWGLGIERKRHAFARTIHAARLPPVVFTHSLAPPPPAE